MTAPGGSSGSTALGGAGGVVSALGGSLERPTIRLVLSRPWISLKGPKARRLTTFIFRLPKRAVVEFIVIRVSPDCTIVGRFRVKGHKGVNRVSFRGRIGRRRLAPGTYRIVAHTPSLPTRPIMVARLVIFKGKPTPAQVDVASASNVCAPANSTEGAGPFEFGAASSLFGNIGGVTGTGGEAKAAAVRDRGGQDWSGDVLGARFSRAGDAVKSIHPLLWIGLGIAIALLALAALPLEAAPNARIAALLAYRRMTVAVAGATTLVAVTIAYALS
jgi:hypothetical protein